MNRIQKIVVLLVISSTMILLTSCEQDPTKGILKVYCQEKYGYSYVEGITIELYSSDSNYKLKTSTTNSEGYVWFNDLIPGSYWVKTNDYSDLSSQASGAGTVEADQITTITLKVVTKN